MSQVRDTFLDKMLNGAAAGLRGKVRDAKHKLDAHGVEHKAAKPTGEATKGLMEAMRAKIEAAIGQVTEGASPELVDAVMQVIMQNAMETPAPVEEPVVEEPLIEEMADDEIPVDEDDEDEEDKEGDEYEDEEEKSLTLKAANLFDDLIQTQSDIVKDLGAITKSVKALEPVVALVSKVEALTTKVAALEKQLSNRPRQASRAQETEIETSDLSPEVQKHLVKRDGFWGVPVVPETK